MLRTKELMTIPVEIMLRGNNRVFAHTVVQPGDPASWTAADMTAILKSILIAIDRAQHPGKTEEPEVGLRGLSWIVHPTSDGVVIALEIHTASAVAGPLTATQQRIDELVSGAVRASRPADVVH
jgi:hypothetical protein